MQEVSMRKQQRICFWTHGVVGCLLLTVLGNLFAQRIPLAVSDPIGSFPSTYFLPLIAMLSLAFVLTPFFSSAWLVFLKAAEGLRGFHLVHARFGPTLA